MTEEVARLAIPARLLHEGGLALYDEYLGRTAPLFPAGPGPYRDHPGGGPSAATFGAGGGADWHLSGEGRALREVAPVW